MAKSDCVESRHSCLACSLSQVPHFAENPLLLLQLLHALSRSRSLVPLYYASTSLDETAFAASIAGSSAHECAFHTCGKPKLFKTNHVRREFHVFGTKFTFYGIRGGGPYNHGKCQPMHTIF